MEQSPASLTIGEIAAAFVEERLGVSPVELLSPRRQANLVEARALFVWIVKTYRPELSYPAVGRMLGGKHHSSIIHLHRMAARRRAHDADFDLHCERFASAFPQRQEARHGSH